MNNDIAKRQKTPRNIYSIAEVPSIFKNIGYIQRFLLAYQEKGRGQQTDANRLLEKYDRAKKMRDVATINIPLGSILQHAHQI